MRTQFRRLGDSRRGACGSRVKLEETGTNFAPVKKVKRLQGRQDTARNPIILGTSSC
jgi:hypothetical protein